MKAATYLKTLRRMKEDETITADEWLDFIGKTPENKVKHVERWKKNNPDPEDIRKEDERFYALLMATIDANHAAMLQLEERLERLADSIERLEEEVFADD